MGKGRDFEKSRWQQQAREALRGEREFRGAAVRAADRLDAAVTLLLSMPRLPKAKIRAELERAVERSGVRVKRIPAGVKALRD